MSIIQRFYKLKTEAKPTQTEAATDDELIILDADTGKVDSYHIMTPVLNPITSDYWWQL